MPVAGQVVGEKYRLESLLDEGYTSSLWAAVEIGTGDGVAVELLSPALSGQRRLVASFVAAGRHAVVRPHPSILAVRDVGVTDQDIPFVVTDLLEGESLAALLERTGPLFVLPALHVMRDLAQGLAAAHAQGEAHGDLRPSNVFFCVTARAVPDLRILNFGLSRAMIAEPDASTPTRITGSLDYLAPEHLRRPGAAPSPRGDVFACGVMLIEMITGQLPLAPLDPRDPTIEAKLADRIAYYSSRQTVPLSSDPTSGVSRRIISLIRDATAIDPMRRLNDAGQMSHPLAEAIEELEQLTAVPIADEVVGAGLPAEGSRHERTVETAPPAYDAEAETALSPVPPTIELRDPRSGRSHDIGAADTVLLELRGASRSIDLPSSGVLATTSDFDLPDTTVHEPTQPHRRRLSASGGHSREAQGRADRDEVHEIVTSDIVANDAIPSTGANPDDVETRILAAPETLLPRFDAEDAPTREMRKGRSAPRRRRTVPVIGAVAVAALFLAFAFVGISLARCPFSSTERATPSAAASGTLLRDRDDVSVVVTSEPSGASVAVDGVPRLETPAVLTLPRSRPARLTFSLDGYQQTDDIVTPDRDLNFRVVLVKAPPPPRGDEDASPGTDADRGAPDGETFGDPLGNLTR